MVVGERNYSDTKGAILSLSTSFGTVEFEEAKSLKLSYRNYDFSEVSAYFGTGFNINRFASGLSGSYSYFNYSRLEDDIHFDEEEKYIKSEKFNRQRVNARYWVQYTFEIKANWDRQKVLLTYDLVNQSKFSSTPLKQNIELEDKKITLGHSFNIGNFSLSYGLKLSTYNFQKIDKYLNLVFCLGRFGFRFSFYNESFKDIYDSNNSEFSVNYVFDVF